MPFLHLQYHLWEHACKLSLCVSCAHALWVNYSACLLAAPLLSHVTSTIQLLLDNAFTHSIITSAADVRTAGSSLDYETQMLQWTGTVWNSMSPWTVVNIKIVFYFPCYQTLLYSFVLHLYVSWQYFSPFLNLKKHPRQPVFVLLALLYVNDPQYDYLTTLYRHTLDYL